MHRPFLFALISMSRATKKFIDGHLFLDEDRLDEKEAQRRNIPMHVFNGFLEQLARDVEQELARLKAQKLPTAQHEATLDNLRRHQSVLELRFLPRSLSTPLPLPFSLSLFPSLSFSLFSPSSLPLSPSLLHTHTHTHTHTTQLAVKRFDIMRNSMRKLPSAFLRSFGRS